MIKTIQNLSAIRGDTVPSITETELKKQIKSGEFSNVYLIYGNESYLKHHYYNLLIKKSVNENFADFNLHIFDSPSEVREIVLAAEAMPMMSERTCVVIKDLKLSDLGDGGRKELIDFLSDIPETCVVIICFLTSEPEGKGWKDLLSVCEKYGSSLRLDKMSKADLIKYVIKGASSRGCTIEYSVADYFLSLVGDNLTSILNELEKLCANTGSGTITKANVEAVTVKNTEVKIFELSKNLVIGNCDKAFSILDSLLKQREEPISIMGTIIMSYVDMYRAKVAASGGHRPEEVMKIFNYGKNDFRLRNGAKNASKMSIGQLRESIEVLAKADESLKSTSINQRLILEEAMIKLFLIANGEKVC